MRYISSLMMLGMFLSLEMLVSKTYAAPSPSSKTAVSSQSSSESKNSKKEGTPLKVTSEKNVYPKQEEKKGSLWAITKRGFVSVGASIKSGASTLSNSTKNAYVGAKRSAQEKLQSRNANKAEHDFEKTIATGSTQKAKIASDKLDSERGKLQDIQNKRFKEAELKAAGIPLGGKHGMQNGQEAYVVHNQIYLRSREGKWTLVPQSTYVDELSNRYYQNSPSEKERNIGSQTLTEDKARAMEQIKNQGEISEDGHLYFLNEDRPYYVVNNLVYRRAQSGRWIKLSEKEIRDSKKFVHDSEKEKWISVLDDPASPLKELAS